MTGYSVLLQYAFQNIMLEQVSSVSFIICSAHILKFNAYISTKYC